MKPSNYEKLSNKTIHEITSKYPFHPKIKEELKETLFQAGENPQDKFEALVLFKKFEIEKILKNDLQAVDYMIDHISNTIYNTIISDNFAEFPLYDDVTYEYEEILNARAESPINKETDADFATELDFFYYSRIVPLLN